MDLKLRGSKGVVMAASRGLGRACAEAFAAEGMELWLCSRDEERIAEVAAQLAATYAVPVTGRAVDITDAAGLTDFIAAAGEAMGGIDTLLTNAGGPPAGGFGRHLEDASWQHAFELNLLSVVRAVRAALPYMRQRPGANLLSIVSSSVKTPIPQLILSNVFRPAIVGLMKSLSCELAPEGIRANCIAPGRIDTERVRELDRHHAAHHELTVEQWHERSVAQIPLGRYGEPHELARLAAFLASDSAGYITGQTMFVDGGHSPVLW